MKDVIADILETVRFKSAVYFKHGFCGNWGMNVEAGNFAQFHFVSGGNCTLKVNKEHHTLSRGDLVIFPNGTHHQIKSDKKAVCYPGKEVVTGILNDNSPFIEGEANTNLVCGHYELDRDVSHFLLEDLPECIVIKSEEYGRFDMINAILDLMIVELSEKKLGHEVVTLRFAEILFISILRHYYLKKATSSMNLFKDQAIYRAINYIHNNIQEALTIEKLCLHSGISRTLFIERFKNSVGNTPLGYIKSWRMTKAKQLLKYSDFTLNDIGEQVGYGSTSAFNRVFKQTFNISPKKFKNSVAAEQPNTMVDF
ncbi:AraC family transcriptional regulator [Flagellimonas sp. S3867]|uniref:AraC family transcriptional regulator n=1 Tax=Flagellimonas sp. S3867 TaxID=2768063 RepID=UPI0016842CC6|nr:AraC family transcriptional regulator [Flagellimonas sp. S3867]